MACGPQAAARKRGLDAERPSPPLETVLGLIKLASSLPWIGGRALRFPGVITARTTPKVPLRMCRSVQHRPSPGVGTVSGFRVAVRNPAGTAERAPVSAGGQGRAFEPPRLTDRKQPGHAAVELAGTWLGHDFSRIPVHVQPAGDPRLPAETPAWTEAGRVHLGLPSLFMTPAERWRMLRHEAIHRLQQLHTSWEETAAAAPAPSGWRSKVRSRADGSPARMSCDRSRRCWPTRRRSTRRLVRCGSVTTPWTPA